MGDANRPSVHGAIDHVRANLDGDLSLARLAFVASFSPHHFHRLFKGETGETTAEFARRARLERAVQLMRGSPERELSSISAEVGFATPSDFSRVFKAHFGCTPSSWDRRSRLGPHDPSFRPDASGHAPDARPPGREDRPVEDPPLPPASVVDRPAMRLAYLRIRDPWRGHHLADGYARLTDLLARRGIGPADGALVGLTWENEKATPLDRLTYDLGVTVDDGIAADDEIGIHELPAAQAVEVRCSSLRQTAAAWDHLYRTWLPSSPYEPADGPTIKRFRRRPVRLDGDAWDVDCSIALRLRWP